ncbi:MAG: autotransporter-associated beta strand repeat-containing protein, partial [Verrucomicrobiia bacterium]
MTTRRRGGLLCLLLMVFSCLPVQAQFGPNWYKWLSSNSGLWSDGTYWDKGTPPFPGFPAYLGSVQTGTTRTITFDPMAGSGIGELYIQQMANATNILVITAALDVNASATLEAMSGFVHVWVQSSSLGVGAMDGILTLSNAVGAATLLTIDGLAALGAGEVRLIGGAVTNSGSANIAYEIAMTNNARWTQLGGQLTASALTNLGGSVFTMSGGLVSFTNRVDNAATFTVTGGTNITPVFFNRSGATVSLSGGAMDVNYVTNFSTWTVSGMALARLTNFVGAGSTLNVSGGSLTIGSLFNATNGSGTINVSGGLLTVGSGMVAMTGTGVVNMTGGSFVWTSAPVIASNATARGTINLNGGTMTVPGFVTGLGTGSLYFNGGVLQFSASTDVTGFNDFAVMAGGAFVDSSNYVISFGQPLTNGLGGGPDGGLTKLGNGTLILTNGNNYNGPTRIVAGSLIGTNFSGPLVIDPGGSIGPTGALNQAYLSWLDSRLASMLTGAVVMAVDSPNPLVFTNHLADAFLGSAVAGGAIYSGSVTWTNSLSTLRFGGGGGLMIYPLTISPINGHNNVIIGPVGGNAMSIVQLNSPGSIYTGGTIVNSGTLRLGGPRVLGNPADGIYVTVNPGGALDLNGYNISTISHTVMISGMGIGPQAGAIYNSGANLVNQGLGNVTLAGDAAIGQNGGGRFDILGVLEGSGNNLYKVGSNQTFMSGAGYITNVPFVIINGGLFGIQGAGQLAGAGATVLQVYTGGTFGIYGNLDFTNALQLYGGTFQNSGPAGSGITTWNGPVAVNGATNFFDTGPGRMMVINGNISGTGAVAKVNASMLVLSGSNSYTGGTVIGSGMLQFSGVNAMPVVNTIGVGTNGVVQFDFANSQVGINRLNPANAAGVIGLTAANVNDNIDLSTPGLSNIWIGASSPVVYSGSITPYDGNYRLGGGGGTLILNGNSLQGAGTLLIGGPQAGMVLMNGSNSFGGATPNTIVGSNGYLSIASIAPIGGVGAGLTFSGGTVQIRDVYLHDFNDLVVNWANSALGSGFNGSLDINNNGNVFTVADNIIGLGITNKLGFGTLVLSGNNMFSTGMVIRAGAVRIQSANALGIADTPANIIQVNSGAALQLAGNIITAPVPITINGGGIGYGAYNNNDGALRNVSGLNTVSGRITLGSPARINADAGSTLSLIGGLTNVNRVTTFGGFGNIVVSGIVGGGASIKDGYGTLTLVGQNTGALSVVSGRVILDYSGAIPASGVLPPNATLALSGIGVGTTTGGTLIVNGPTAGNTVTQWFSSVAINAGNNTIIATNNGGDLTVNLGALIRGSLIGPNNNFLLSNGVVNFVIPGGTPSVITTTTTNNNSGVLGGWATINGSDWAMVTNVFDAATLKITNYNAYVSFINAGWVNNGSNQNIKITSRGLTNYYGLNSGSPLNRTVTVNSILATGPGMSVITNAGVTLRLGQSGGIFVPTNSGGLTIGASINDGFLTAGGANGQAGELIFINNSVNPINVNAGITTNRSGPLMSVSFNGSGVVNIYGSDVRGSSGAVISNNATFVNAGTVNYYGTNTQSGLVAVRGGTLNLLPSSVSSFRWTTVVDGPGVLNANGFLRSATNFTVGATVGSRAVMNIGGNLAFGAGNSGLQVGNGAGSAGAVYQTGGVVNIMAGGDSDDTFSLGNNGYGYYRITGGTLTDAGRLILSRGAAGVGVMDILGGRVFNTRYLLLSYNAAGQMAAMNVLGGQISSGNANESSISSWSSPTFGMLTIGGGDAGDGVANFAINNARSLWLVGGGGTAGAGGTGIVNLLSGGTLIANRVVAQVAGTSLLNFNGGTLKAAPGTTLGSTFASNLMAAVVYENGAIIDSDTNNVTFLSSLIAPVGYGLDNIAVANGGIGYIGAPLVYISGGSGTGATAIAQIDLNPGSSTYQRVTNIMITSAGSGYLSNDWLTVQMIGGGAIQAAQLGTFSFGTNVGGSLTKLGTGVLTLAASNSYTGGTILGAGVLSVSNDWNIAGSTSALVFSGGLLQIIGTAMSNIDSHVVNWNSFNGGIDIVSTSNFFTTTNIIAGNGNFTKIGAGTLLLTNVNTYTGNTLIGGPVEFDSLGAFGGSGRSIYYINAVFAPGSNVNNAALLNRLAITENSFALALTADTAENLDLSLFPNGYLGAYTGSVVNYTGVLKWSPSRVALGGGGGTLIFNNQQIGGTPNYIGIGYTNVTIGMPGSVGNTVVTTNNHAYLGTTTINVGNTLQLGNGGNSGSLGSGLITNSGTLVFNRSDSFLITNNAVGNGNVVVTGGGTMTYSGFSSMSGTNTIDGSTFVLKDAALPGAVALTNGARFIATGNAVIGEFSAGPSFAIITNVASLAAIQTLFANGTGYAIQYGVLGNQATFDYPGTSPLPLQGTSFAMGRWEATLNVLTNGLYQFNLPAADDYGNIFVDGVRVTAGGNGAVGSMFTLSAGSHSIVIYSANNTGPYGVQVDVTAGGSRQRLPLSMLTGPGVGIGSLSGSADSTLVISNGTLMINQTSDGTFAGVISEGVPGSGVIKKVGTNTLTLSGVNTYTGGTLLGAGRLSVSNDNNLGGVNTPITFNGGLLQVTGTTLTNLGTHVVNWSSFNGGFDIADAGNVFRVTNSLSDGGNFYKYGSGTLVLSGSNSYTGVTVINGGILQQANAFAFGSNRVFSINGGTLDLNGYSLITTNLAFLSGYITDNGAPGFTNTVVLTNLPTSTFGGVITDGANGRQLALTVYGSNLLTLTNFNSYSGNTILNTGVTLVLSGVNGGIGGTTNIVVNGAMVVVNNTAAANNANRLGYGTPLWLDNARFSFTNDGGSAVYTANIGTLNLMGGVNTFISRQSSGTGTNLLVFSSVSRSMGAVADFVSTNIGVNSQNMVRFTTVPTRPGNGTIFPWATINGTNWATYDTGRDSVSNFYAYTFGPDSTWDLDSNVSTNNSLSLSSFITINSLKMALTANASFDLGGNMLALASGGLLVGGASWGFTMSNGFLTASDGSSLAMELFIIQNAALPMTNSAVIMDNPLGTVLTLVKAGTGTLVLANTNSYSGGTFISAGTLYITNDSVGDLAGSLGVINGAALTIDGGTLQTTNNFALNNRPTVLGVAGGTFVVDNNSILIHTNLISGVGTLFKGGTGTLILSNVNTYSGGTVITNGTIYVFGDNNNLGVTGAPVILAGGGALRVTNSFTFGNRPFTMGVNGGFINIDANSSVTITNTIIGTGSLSLAGPGTLTLSGDNTYAGGTTNVGGTLRLGSDTALGFGALTMSGGTLAVTGPRTLTNALAINANSIIDVSGGRLTLTGPGIPGGPLPASNAFASMTVTGGNGLVVANNLRHRAGTYVSGGSTLILSNNAALNSQLTISNGATVITMGAPGLMGEYFVATVYSNNMPSLTVLQNLFASSFSNQVFFNYNSTNFDNPASTPYQPLAGVGNAVARYQGQLNTPTNGVYQFNLPNADDYGAIFIDGVRVTTGNNGAAGIGVYLTAGAHNIVIYNANNGGGYGIQVDVVMPGESVAQRLPNWMLSGSGPAIGSLSGGATARLFLSNSVLSIAQTNDTTFSGYITGAGGINKLGTNTLTLAATTNNWSGGVILSAGRVSIGNLGSLGVSTNMLSFEGGILQITGTAITDLGSHPINTSSGMTFNGGFDIAAAANVFNLTNVIFGPGGVAKYGAGVLNISGNNSFLGGVGVNAGTVRVSNVNALGYMGLLTLAGNGGVVDLNGNSVVIGGLSASNVTNGVGLTGSGLITDNSAGPGTTTLTISNIYGNTVFGGIITNGASKELALTFGGSGILSLTNNNGYTGPTVINAGRIWLTNTLGAISQSASITINPGAGLTLSNTPAANNAGRLRSDATLIMNGGDFAFGNPGTNLTFAAIYTQNVGNLSVNAGASSINIMQVGSTSTNTLVFASMSRAPTATINFVGTNLGVNDQNIIRFTVAPVLNNGIIGPWASANSGSSIDWATYNNAISNYAAYASINNTTNWNASVNALVSQGGNATLTQVLNATNYTANVRATSAFANQPGYWNLAGYGATILGGGLLDSTLVNNDFVIHSGTLTAGTNNAGPVELIYTRWNAANAGYFRANLVDNGPMSPLTLVKSGAGNLVLGTVNNYWGSSNSYSGGTIISSGILYMGTDGGYQESPYALGSGAVTVMPGAQLRLGGSIGAAIRGVDYMIANDMTNNGGLIYAVAGNQHLAGIMTMVGTNGTFLANWALNDLYIDGVVTGPSGVRITTTGNGGAVFFSNTNNYAGGTFIEGGYLYLGSTNSLNGPLFATNAGVIGAAYAIDQDFLNRVDNLAALPVSASIGMATNSAFDLDFSSLANFTTNVYLVAAPRRTVQYDGTLTPALGTYRLGGGPQFGTLVMGRQLTGAYNLVINNAGIVVLTNNNDYTGYTFINGGGTLQIGSNTTTGTLGSGMVTNAGTLVFSRSDVYTNANFINGGGVVVQNGTGTLQMVGTNIFTGGMVVNSGILQAGSTNPFGSGTVTVNFGGTVDLNHLDPTMNALAGQFGSLVTDNSADGGVTMLKLGGANIAMFSGIIADGALTRVSVGKSGTGAEVFAGKNAYTGGTLVSAGILRATYGVGLPYVGNLTLISNGVFETGVNFTNALGPDNGQVQILAGGNAGFSPNGIYGYEAYGSRVAVNLGGATNPVVWGSLYFNPNQFVLNAGSTNNVLEFQNPIDLNGATRYINVGGSTSIVSGTIFNGSSTPSVLQKEGNGWLYVTSPMVFTGGVYANGGTLVLATNNFITAASTVANGATLYIYSDASLGSATNFILGNTNNWATTLRVTNNVVFSRNITMGGDASIYVDYSSVLILSNALAGAKRLNATGPGTLILDNAGDNLWGLDTRGTVLATTNALNATTNQGGFFGSVTTGALGLYGSAIDSNFLRFVSVGAVKANTAFLGALVLGQDSGSELNFNIYQGITNAFLGAGYGTWTYTGKLNGWTQSTIGNTLFGISSTNFLLGGGNGTLVYAPVIGGRTNVIIGPVGGIGTVYLSAQNTFSGTAAVVGSTLRAEDGVGLPTTANLLLTGGVFEIISQAAGTNFSRTLGTGLGQMRVVGTTSGFSTTNGATTILLTNLVNNVIQWGSTFFNPTAALVLNTNTASDTLTLANNLDLNNANRAIYVGGNTAVVSGLIYSSGGNGGNQGLVKWGSGTLLLADNNFQWGNTVNDGILQVGSPLALGSIGIWYQDRNAGARSALVMNGGVLDLNGNNVLVESLAGNLGAVITDNSTTPGVTRFTAHLPAGGDLTLNTTYAGSIQDGTNGRQLAFNFGQEVDDNRRLTLTLPYSNSYSGGTFIYGGDLLIGSTNSLGSGSLRMAGGGSLGPAYAMLDQSFLNWAASRSDSSNRLNGVFIMQGLGANRNTNNFDFTSSALTNAFLGVAYNNTVLYAGEITPGASAYRLGGGGGTLIMDHALTGAYDLIIGPVGAATSPNAGGMGPNVTSTVQLTNANSYTGITWVRQGAQLYLSNVTGNAITGNLRIGDGPTAAGGVAAVRLGASEQISDTATITFEGNASTRNPFFILMGNNETVSGISATDGMAVMENREGDGVNTSGVLTVSNNVDNVYYGYIRDFSSGMSALGGPTFGLTKNGTGSLTLAGANINFSGPLTINQGVLTLSDIGQYGGIISNNSVLVLDTKGSGRNFSLVRPICGTGAVWKTGPNTVKLDFSGGGAPMSNIFNASAPLNVAGGLLWFSGAANYVASQRIDRLNVVSGYSAIVASNGPLGQPVVVDIGWVNRGAGSVLQVLGTGGSVVSGAPRNTPSGIIGGWALYGLNDWAANDGSGLFTNYTSYATPNLWSATANVTIDSNGIMPAAMGTTGAVNSLRFVNSTAYGLNLTNRGVVIQSGGILFGSSNALNSIISGGTITSGTNELLVTINRIGARREGNAMIIGSQIINNGSTGVTLVVAGVPGGGNPWDGGSALLALTNNANAFTGGIILDGGGIIVGTDGALGAVPGVAGTNIWAMGGYNWLRNSAAMTINAKRGIFVNTNAVLYLDARSGTQTVAGVISGSGRLVVGIPSFEARVYLINTNTLTGIVEVNGALNAQDGVGLPTTANLFLNSDAAWGNRSILEMTGTFTRALGAGAGQWQLWNAGQPNNLWGPNQGGFAAVGGALTVNVGGDGHTVLWGESFFNPGALAFGDNLANYPVTWVNPIDLNGGVRVFYVFQTGIISGALTSGTLSGVDGPQYSGGGIYKDQSGLLWLTATNSYPGYTVIWGGTLRAEEGVGMPVNSPLIMQYGGYPSVFEGSNDFTRPLITSAMTAYNPGYSYGVTTGGVSLAGVGTAGFAAYGDDRTVNIGGDRQTLVWSNVAAPSLIVNNSVANTIYTVVNGDTSNLRVGMAVYGSNLMANAYIVRIDSWNQFVLNTTSAFAGTTPLTFSSFNPGTFAINGLYADHTLTLVNDIDLNGGTNAGGSIRGFYVGGATGIISGTITNTGSGVASILKTGRGVLWLPATNWYNGLTVINMGTLRVDEGVGIVTNRPVVMMGLENGTGITVPAILELSNDFTRPLLSVVNSNGVSMGAVSGGFSAQGRPVTVDLGTNLIWGALAAPNMVMVTALGSGIVTVTNTTT